MRSTVKSTVRGVNENIEELQFSLKNLTTYNNSLNLIKPLKLRQIKNISITINHNDGSESTDVPYAYINDFLTGLINIFERATASYKLAIQQKVKALKKLGKIENIEL